MQFYDCIRCVMCDSHISESCPMDFTNYCPVDSLVKEARAKPLPHKPHPRNHITWFSRKAKGTATRNSKQVITSKQSSSKVPEQRCSDSDRCETYSNSPHGDVYTDSAESSSDEEYNLASANSWSLEKPSLYVSQEELDALKGCVTRRRAVFSPSPSSSPVHSVVYQRRKSSGFYSSLPAESKRLVLAEEISHVRQSSLEYDHLKDFNPHVSADSVSVQFRLQGCEEGGGSQDIVRYDSANNEHYSIPERLGADVHRDVDICKCKTKNASLSQHQNVISSSCDIQLVQERERCPSNLPQNEHPCTVRANNEPLKEGRTGKTVDASPSSIGRSNLIQHHHSPHHSQFNSPLLSKHQLFGSMRTCYTGSNYSLYSQTTTLSSATDRQHCSYSKGVDGNLFRDRTDVRMFY